MIFHSSDEVEVTRCTSFEKKNSFFLLFLSRLAAAAPTGPLVWDPPYAEGVPVKKKKN